MKMKIVIENDNIVEILSSNNWIQSRALSKRFTMGCRLDDKDGSSSTLTSRELPFSKKLNLFYFLMIGEKNRFLKG